MVTPIGAVLAAETGTQFVSAKIRLRPRDHSVLQLYSLVRYAITPPSKGSRDASKNRSDPVTERKKPPWPGDLVVSPVSAVSTAPTGVTTP